MTKNREIKVTSCGTCPFEDNGGQERICNADYDNGNLFIEEVCFRVIPDDIDSIPEWCPLGKEDITVTLFNELDD